MSGFRTSLLFDMRAPRFGTPVPDLYQAALEMAAFADRFGVDSINLMEHHGSDDGYLPTPFVLGGAMAAKTKRCRIALGAVLLPLHDPVKIAEQMAVLDLASGGRLQVTFGAGYVPFEFQMFKSSLRDRGRLLDEGLEIILRALRGERFVADGREILVRPLPLQTPEAMILVGGGVEASARRAARFGVGFAPMQPHLFDLYDSECRKYGREPGRKQGPSGPLSIHLTHDPDAAWAKLTPHFKHMIHEYARWAESEAGASSPFRGLLDSDEALRQCGMFAVLTPDELVARASSLVGAYSGLGFMPLISGLAPEIGWESLELLKDVIPRLKNAAEAQP